MTASADTVKRLNAYMGFGGRVVFTERTKRGQLTAVVERHQITQIYLLAAALSANGEKHPQWAWNLNMTGLLNVLEIARTHKLDKVFWPSSIAAFGPTTPADGTPQGSPTVVARGGEELVDVRITTAPAERGRSEAPITATEEGSNRKDRLRMLMTVPGVVGL